MKISLDGRLSFAERMRMADRLLFKVAVLLGLFGFSIGPVLHSEITAKVLGVVASGSLTVLAGAFLFRRRQS
jgi:uncharacterized membrane protein